MNVLQRTYRRAVLGVKGLVMRWTGSPGWRWGSTARTRFDYAGAVGDGRSNSAVEAVIGCICRVFPEAPIGVVAVAANGDRAPVPAHPMTQLLRRPNPHYSGLLLWQATLADWLTDGNAYWGKVRSAGGRVTELWWLPASLVEPKYPDDGSAYLSHYEYRPGGGTPIRVEPRDVVHFRNGLDPANPRKGRSPLSSLLREIFTDDEAAAYTAALLRNMGGPGVIISIDDGAALSQEEADRIKTDYEARFGGDNRGRVLVIGTKATVDLPGFSPQQMDLAQLRKMPESRIAAIYGAAAMVVGLEVGLEHSIYANYAEAREALYESNIIPTQRLFAADLDTQLLPDFGDPARQEVVFDNANVRVLQPDMDKLYERLDRVVRGGILTPNEAREKMGWDKLPGGDVVYLPIAVTPTDPADLLPPESVDVVPPVLPEPAPLRALPQPAKGREQKAAAHNLAAGLTRLRARHQGPLERDLARYLEGQRARVLAALSAQETASRGADAAQGVEVKLLSWRDLFDAVAETRSLTRVLERWYRRVLTGVHSLSEDALGVSWELDDTVTRDFLARAGEQIKDITTHTQEAIAAALQDGQAAGEGIPQLAARIEALTQFGKPRATLIARSELGSASNRAAITAYTASAVVHGVEIFDGDGCGLRSHSDPQKANGVKLRLDQLGDIPMLSHPACVRAFGAVVDASELEAVA